ncbi:MAG: sensor histidine kinase [Chitinophagaceae bacterium]|nr:MAG: sensor histidine kinase [Chitinophagaceae bacterium]
MSELIPPVPDNEMERILKLSELDVDYAEVQDSLQDLSKLAAKVAGTPISLINLIDSFTQWTVSNYGLPLEQMPRHDSVCQYTIVAKEEKLEVKDLSVDDRFKDKFYVTGPPLLKYYFGVPLQTADGLNLGALCVLDKVGREISPEKIELLKIIANEIVNRLTAYQVIKELKSKVREAGDTQRKVAHDIRGPLGGIVSLAQIISQQGNENKMDQVLEFIGLIQKSGRSLLELANEILGADKRVDASAVRYSQTQATADTFTLQVFKDKLEKLFTPQAIPKDIRFTVRIHDQHETIPFSKNKLLQITGNLISNAIKFTPQHGSVTVELGLVVTSADKNLQIKVTDTGVGLDAVAVQQLFTQGAVSSTSGTVGEQGYGFGLALVKHLVDDLKGNIDVVSKPGEGAVFTIAIPNV